MVEKPWGSPLSQISWMQTPHPIFGIHSFHKIGLLSCRYGGAIFSILSFHTLLTYLQTNSSQSRVKVFRHLPIVELVLWRIHPMAMPLPFPTEEPRLRKQANSRKNQEKTTTKSPVQLGKARVITWNRNKHLPNQTPPQKRYAFVLQSEANISIRA